MNTTPSVLLVDDRETNLEVLEAVLQGLDADLLRAYSGSQAIEITRKREPAVILLDVKMPGMDGLEAARQLRALEGRSHVPIVFITARLDSSRTMFEGYASGAVDFLVKPIEPWLVRGKVKVFLQLFLLRAEITTQAEELTRQSAFKSEFMANMSHELRTPLNAIIGFSQLIQRGKAGPISELHKEYLGDILSSAHHLLEVINDVLDLARIESGKMAFRPERVELPGLVNDTLNIVRVLADDKSLHLEAQISSQIGTLTIDPARFKQVLFNYLSNAIKFTLEGGRIMVRGSLEGEASFRLEVEDTGIGISEEMQERLFVAFEQLEPGRARRYSGTGLGLALARQIVEAQGGRVGVESQVGVGTTFWAVLPKQTTTDETANDNP